MPKNVEILSREQIFNKAIFRINETRFRHELFTGGMSQELVRLDFERGDSVSAVVHRTDTHSLIFTEQFRISTYEKGPGWLLELPAGMIEESENPADSMKREIEEEIGFRTTYLQLISKFYVSPGGTSERIILFYAQVNATQRVSRGGGLRSEGEDIRVVEVPILEVFRRMDAGKFVDAKTIIGLQWLRAHQK
jgi:ADP-ribose pyrophosphatase